MLWKIAASLFAVLVAFAALAGVARVAWHEDHEVHLLERASIAQLSRRDGATSEGVRLARVHLTREQEVTFEVCADDPMEPGRWAGAMALAIWRPRARELMTRSELDAETLALVRRNATHGCLTLGRGTIGVDDDYAVEAIWEQRPSALARIPLTTTVLAHRPIDSIDRWLVILGWLGAIGFVVSLALRRPGVIAAEVRTSSPDLDEWEKEQASAGPKIPDYARVIIGLVLVVLSFLASGFMPAGPALALGVSVVLALFETGVGIALAPGPGLRRRFTILALARPERRAWLFFPLAVVAGLVLFVVANLSTLIVPSTGQSAIQTFVSWPSGLLSFAALAVFAPLAEEIFFRGFVYGVLEQRSRAIAFAGAWLLFVLAHAPQTWGQWGALVAITVTGLVLTALRAASKSTLVPALAHLVYNGVLAVTAISPPLF